MMTIGTVHYITIHIFSVDPLLLFALWLLLLLLLPSLLSS
jgi:hypothetical protein